MALVSYSETGLGYEEHAPAIKSGDVKGTTRSDLRYFMVSRDVRRHRLISISYISLLPCHGRGRGFESRRPRHIFKRLQTARLLHFLFPTNQGHSNWDGQLAEDQLSQASGQKSQSTLAPDQAIQPLFVRHPC
jgi:hypothetical protein